MKKDKAGARQNWQSLLFRRGGFTIVELLVVVVVIAILASVTVVAYGGIRQSAVKSNLASTIQAYAKAFQLYAVDHGGEFPAGDWRCLGDVSQYPATGLFDEGRCNDRNSSYIYPVDAGLMNAIRPYLSSSPSLPPHTPGQNAYGGKVRGLIYDQVASHTSGHATITFFIDEVIECPIGRKTSYHTIPTSTRCEYLIPK